MKLAAATLPDASGATAMKRDAGDIQPLQHAMARQARWEEAACGAQNQEAAGAVSEAATHMQTKVHAMPRLQA